MTKYCSTIRFVLVSSILLLVQLVFGAVRLPAIFNNGMVLQQQSMIHIWGWAEPGEKISITGNWGVNTVQTVTGENGNWSAMIRTTAAGGPYQLSIQGNNKIELRDILMGEVWVCSGQSNMGFSLKSDADAKTEIPAANYPLIRYFSVERQYGLQDFNDAPGSSWKKTSPAVAGSFSAVAFYFAKKLQAKLKAPVGILYAAWGGTPAEAWTPAPVLKSDTVLAQYFDRWQYIQEHVGADSVAYNQAMARWYSDSSSGKKPAEPQTFYYYKRPWREPSVLFNGMIQPLIPYTIKGVLWYQGESNVGYADEYNRLFSAMIQSWRKAWNQPALPFYFVQIAPYGYSNLDAAARLREGQYQVLQQLSNTGMVVTVDVGNMHDIHFTHKKEVGNRLAWLALDKNYGLKNTGYKGPEAKLISRKKNKIKVSFTTGAGLIFTGKQAGGFEIGYGVTGSDSIAYVKAIARVTGNDVEVWNDEVSNPVAVRYAWLLPGEASLTDRNGLPAFPFRMKIKTVKK